jgi:hypothetical protein
MDTGKVRFFQEKGRGESTEVPLDRFYFFTRKDLPIVGKEGNFSPGRKEGKEDFRPYISTSSEKKNWREVVVFSPDRVLLWISCDLFREGNSFRTFCLRGDSSGDLREPRGFAPRNGGGDP